jgi:hypothetical protein
MSSEEQVAGTRSRHWKFSLRTMLLAIAFLCLAGPLIYQSIRLRNAEIELSKLRDETGRMTIKDRTKLHVMLVGGSNDPQTWKWRLFIPKGFRYGWNVAYGDTPANGLPKKPMYGFWNAQGEDADKEVLVTASLHKTENGDWKLSVGSRIGDSKDQMGGTSITFTDKFWHSTYTGSEINDILGNNQTELLDPTKPIVLLKHRAAGTDADGQVDVTISPTPGYAIWMTPF